MWRSRIPQLVRRWDASERMGLNASAKVLEEAVRERLRRGYTTGAFTTGAIAESVRAEPAESRADAIASRVSSPSPAALAWEVGHVNLFTRRFERVEVWRETLINTRHQQAAAYARVMKREIER